MYIMRFHDTKLDQFIKTTNNTEYKRNNYFQFSWQSCQFCVQTYQIINIIIFPCGVCQAEQYYALFTGPVSHLDISTTTQNLTCSINLENYTRISVTNLLKLMHIQSLCRWPEAEHWNTYIEYFKPRCTDYFLPVSNSTYFNTIRIEGTCPNNNMHPLKAVNLTSMQCGWLRWINFKLEYCWRI